MVRKSIGLLLGMLLFFAMVCCAQSSISTTTVRILPGGAVRLKATPVDAAGYQWVKDGSAIINAKESTYLATAPGIYTVITYNVGGCASEPADPIIILLDDVLTTTADIQVIKTSESRSITVNEIFDYTLKVQNNGPDAANKIIVTDVLPKELALEQLVTPLVGVAKYNLNTRTVTWEISKMEMGENADLKIKVKATAGGTIRNAASVTATETDPAIANNISVDLKPIIEIKVPNVFTPNNDGKNDYFKITGLEFFTENQLKIVNRWGSSVYEKDGYLNNWTADGLSNGTYFYVLRVKTATSEWQQFKGYVTIIR